MDHQKNLPRTTSLDVRRSTWTQDKDTIKDTTAEKHLSIVQEGTSAKPSSTSDQPEVLRRNYTEVKFENLQNPHLALANIHKQLQDMLDDYQILLDCAPDQQKDYYQEQVNLYTSAKEILGDFKKALQNDRGQAEWTQIVQEASKKPDEANKHISVQQEYSQENASALVANAFAKQEITQLADQCDRSYTGLTNPELSQLKERVLLPLVNLVMHYKDEYLHHYKYDHPDDYRDKNDYDYNQVYLDDRETEHQSEIKFRASVEIFQTVWKDRNTYKVKSTENFIQAINATLRKLQDTLSDNEIILGQCRTEHDTRQYKWQVVLCKEVIKNLENLKHPPKRIKEEEWNAIKLQSFTEKHDQAIQTVSNFLPQLKEEQRKDLKKMLADTSTKLEKIQQALDTKEDEDHFLIIEEMKSIKVDKDRYAEFVENVVDRSIAEFEYSLNKLSMKIKELSVAQEAPNIERDLTKDTQLSEKNKAKLDSQEKEGPDIDKWLETLSDPEK